MDTTSQTSVRAANSSAVALNAVDWIALVLLIIGGINWGLVGLFSFDLVAAIFGSMSVLSRIVYVLVGIAAIWGVVLAARLGRRA